VLEAKYGFNKTTPATFVADQVKGLVLAAALGGPIVALLLWLFGKFPNAWIYAWLATSGFILLMTYVGPKYIMPMFNKFTPLADGELKSSITAMAERCGFPFAEISVMDGSKRSTRSNAFFAGIGKTKIIALFDTLIEKHSVPELTAVLAHEIGHFKCRHIVQRLVMSLLQMGLLFFLLGLFLNNTRLHEAFGVPQTSVYVSFVLFLLLFEPLQFLIGIASAIWSRKHEFEADAYASKAMDGPQSLISGLKKLACDNLTNVTPHPFYVFLNYSHPPMRERLAALQRL
jgi:STE24 endopeptidase